MYQWRAQREFNPLTLFHLHFFRIYVYVQKYWPTTVPPHPRILKFLQDSVKHCFGATRPQAPYRELPLTWPTFGKFLDPPLARTPSIAVLVVINLFRDSEWFRIGSL